MSQSSSLNNTALPPELLDEVPVQDFADDFAEAILEAQDKRRQLNASANMAAPPCRPPIAVQEDISEEVEHKRTLAPMNDFILAFGLWCETESISRQSYRSLLECLHLLRTVAPIAALPSTVSTLKKNIWAQLPLMQLRRQPLALIPEKLPTLRPQEKPLASSILKEMLYWFDPTKLIQVILSSSEYRGRMHIGMANYVDKPSELWESFAWGSSIRACSREFAKYPDGTPIFPSDIVLLICCKAGCWCRQGTKKHMGRVHTVRRDYTSKAGTPGEILLSIQKIVGGPNIQRIILDFEVPASNSNSQECFLIEDDVFWTVVPDVLSRVKDIELDYHYEGKLQSKSYTTIYFIRSIVNYKLLKVRPIQLSAPPRGELELAVYGRPHFEAMANTQCISVPCQGHRTMVRPYDVRRTTSTTWSHLLSKQLVSK